MKPTRVDNCRVHAIVTRDSINLVIVDSEGRTITFQPPASPVTQKWADELRKAALRAGEQLRLKF